VPGTCSQVKAIQDSIPAEEASHDQKPEGRIIDSKNSGERKHIDKFRGRLLGVVFEPTGHLFVPGAVLDGVVTIGTSLDFFVQEVQEQGEKQGVD
jgi:hypothetical protein